MAAPLKKDAWVDPSKQASDVLDYILEDTSDETIEKREVQSSVEEERTRAPLRAEESNRTRSRVLFLTRDVSVLQRDSILQLQFMGLREVFDEIHILVLSQAWEAKQGVERIADTIWAYTTSGRYWWSQAFVAQKIARMQLQFTDGFRPDVVVALDPFESGLAGLWIAEKFDREFQVHVTEDFFDPEFIARDEHNKLRLRVASYVLNRTQSIRVGTNALKEMLKAHFKHIEDIALLPRHYDIRAIIEATEKQSAAADAFPQFSFTVLFIGKLDHESTLFRTIDACRGILRSPSIGLVVLGKGPHQKEFKQRAEILGIEKQVIFKEDESQLINYMHSANVLMCTDTTEASDEVVIKAAAAGLPLIAAKTDLRSDLFTDGESAFLCDKEDTIAFAKRLGQFLNDNSLRTQFAQNARDIIKTRLHEDPGAYAIAYRDSIEQVLIDEQAEAQNELQNEPQKEAV